MIYGITILRTFDQCETIKLILFAAKQKIKIKNSTLARSSCRPKSLMKQQLYILQGLPDIGPVLAKRLLDHFKMVKAVFNASVNELLEVEGIGLTKAKKIYATLIAVSS